MPVFTVQGLDTEHAFGTDDGLLLCLWRGHTTRMAVAALRKLVFALVERSPNRIMMMTVVEANAAMPEARVRDELSELFRALGPRVSASALVFEGDGFRAAAVRAIATGMNLVAKQPFPHRVFGDLQEAAAWMVTCGPPALGAKQIVGSLAALRHALDEAARPLLHAR